MKKSFLVIIALFACSFFAAAQETIKSDPNEDAQDKIQQEAPRPTQARVERAAKIAAEREEQNKKQKAARQNQIEKQQAEKDRVLSEKAKNKAAMRTKGKLNPEQ